MSGAGIARVKEYPMSIFKDILKVLRQQEVGPLAPFPEGINQYGLSISSRAVSLSVPPDAISGDVYVHTAAISITRDRSDPSATRGFFVYPDDQIKLDSHAKLRAFRAIRQGGADATVDVEYFKAAS